ncbi:FliM/FliN family flagellar motor switch protein [uncultured Ferrimonas sp.]|uniref:FliM/FliN family flagellar motor switch protein n=1 Tax=uncultured Ferrimonas sp. TaxID=432640 RepID=UPI00262B305E|nr:FliM/FliN family flagellar motor switch protein [uncultured Ferrimonas sp.]
MRSSAFIDCSERTADYPSRSLIKGDAAFAHQRDHWQQLSRPMLLALNDALKPLLRQGYPELTQLQLNSGHEVVAPSHLHPWRTFVIAEQSRLLAVLRIDPCTLLQLAGAYYGSKHFQWLSPLQSQLKPELRQAERLLKAVLSQLSPEVAVASSVTISTTTELAPEHYREGVEFVGQWPDDVDLPELSLWFAPELADRFYCDESLVVPEAPDLSQGLKHKLEQVPVQLKVELASMSIPLHNLHQLKPGEILPINLHPSCPVTIAGRRLFTGQVHTQEHSMVVKISHD